VSLHTNFAAFASLVEGQLLAAEENRVQFVILWHRKI